MRSLSRSGAYLICLLLALVLPAQASFASADCTPLAGHDVRWIVPNKPGGGQDGYSRLIQPYLERRLGVRIVIENRPDAGGIVGALAISGAAPDGRTLGLVNAPGLLTADLLPQSIAPNPATDFTVLGRITSDHLVMLTGRSSGLKNIDDLLTQAQERKIVVGVNDLGSSSFYSVPVTAGARWTS